jgi:hypothetical protein
MMSVSIWIYCRYQGDVMYMAQEMYDLILSTYFEHEVTSFTG